MIPYDVEINVIHSNEYNEFILYILIRYPEYRDASGYYKGLLCFQREYSNGTPSFTLDVEHGINVEEVQPKKILPLHLTHDDYYSRCSALKGVKQTLAGIILYSLRGIFEGKVPLSWSDNVELPLQFSYISDDEVAMLSLINETCGQIQ